MTKRLWVKQYNWPTETEHEVSLEVKKDELVIDLIGGNNTIHIERDVWPALIGLLFPLVLDKCNEKET